jgi:hypothetical protein
LGGGPRRRIGAGVCLARHRQPRLDGETHRRREPGVGDIAPDAKCRSISRRPPITRRTSGTGRPAGARQPRRWRTLALSQEKIP